MPRSPRFIILPTLLCLSAWVAGCASQSKSSDGESNHRILEIRAGDVVEVEGWSKTSLVIGGNTVWMSSEITVDESMIEDAETTLAADGRPGVLVTLDDTGAARLQDLTTRRTSRPVVVVVDGDPVSAPVVLSPLSRLFIITAEDLDASEAEAFTARLAAKPRVQDDM